MRDFAGIFGDYCKVVFYQCYTYAESVAKQSFVGADDSVRPPYDDQMIFQRADRVVGPYSIIVKERKMPLGMETIVSPFSFPCCEIAENAV